MTKCIEIKQDTITKGVTVSYENGGEHLREESDKELNNVRMVVVNVKDEVFDIINRGDSWANKCRDIIK